MSELEQKEILEEQPDETASDSHADATQETAAVIIDPPPTTNESSSSVFTINRDAINYLIVAAVFLGLGLLIGLNIGEPEVDARQMRVIVQDVVAETLNEELVGIQETLLAVAAGGGEGIDPEALAALVQSAVEETVNRVDFMEDDDPFLGPEDAPVVIVEFSDFLCQFCGRHFNNTLTPLLENYDGYIRYVYRDFPGVGGQNAIEAALAAECANDQDKFWEYHSLLFENQQLLSTNDMGALNEVFVDHANSLELDMDEFNACIEDRTHVADIVQDLGDAQSIGARGTPAFLINGTFISGAQAYEVFAGVINDKLEELGIEIDPA